MNWRTPRGERRPPPEIEAEMMAVGKAGDDVRLGPARAKYAAWLADRNGELPIHTDEEQQQ